MAPARVEVVVSGRVQGVGFRVFVLREATAAGVVGAVWNRPDGSVGLEAEGDRPALERLIERLAAGPPGARVSEVSARWSDPRGERRSFEIEPTRRA
jgi:acylphosphatase